MGKKEVNVLQKAKKEITPGTELIFRESHLLRYLIQLTNGIDISSDKYR